MSTSEKPRSYRVRFESYDDFLVEYGEHLRKHVLVLPVDEVLAAGTPLRIKLTLPDGGLLVVQGQVVEPDLSDTVGEGGVRVRVPAWTDEQRAILEACVAKSAGEASLLETADGPLNLLLVDDSVTVRLEMGDALRERGVRVRSVDNGLAAISAALKRPPDIVLADVEMPVMDGWMLLRMIRSRPRLASVPFVFFTRLDDEMSRLQGYRMGVDDFVPKSISADELLVRLRGVMARRGRKFDDRAPAGAMRGDLQHVRLGSVLSFLEQERRSGGLTVDNGRERVTVVLEAGQVVAVDELGPFARTEDRLFCLLEWGEGRFEFIPGEPGEPEGAGARRLSVTYLLMEHARRVDEAAAQ